MNSVEETGRTVQHFEALLVPVVQSHHRSYHAQTRATATGRDLAHPVCNHNARPLQEVGPGTTVVPAPAHERSPVAALLLSGSAVLTMKEKSPPFPILAFCEQRGASREHGQHFEPPLAAVQSHQHTAITCSRLQR